MSVVFLFLTLLVFTTNIMSKLVLKFFPEQEKPAAPAVRKSSADVEIAVAIAAVKAHTQS